MLAFPQLRKKCPPIGTAAFATIIAGAAFGASEARATAGSPVQIPVQLSFDGAPGCGDRQALEHEIELRSKGVYFTGSEPAAVTAGVRLVRAAGHFDSVVFVRLPDHPVVTRAITARDCQEVIEGTALIIAVMVSQHAEALEPTEPADVSSPVPPPAKPTEPLAWRFGGGVSGILVEGIAPGPLPGIGVFVDFSTKRQGFAPAVRLSLHHARASGFSADGTRAAFGLTSGVVTACPFAWLSGDDWTVRPCGTSSYGSLEASGSGTDAPTERHPWASVGGVLELQFSPLSGLSFELGVALEAALVNSRFLAGDPVFHETSPVTGRLSLGILGRLP